LILDEVDNFESWCKQNGIEVHRPNSMNNYGVILDEIGFYDVIQDLVKKYINPLTSLLYKHIEDLDSHHSFIVSYEIGKDEDLDFHVDESEVTLNVNLGKEFVGGDLYFGGIRCSTHQNTLTLKNEDFHVGHSIGNAILHLGKHRHAAEKILSGERYNLILWCRSSKFSINYNVRGCPTWCNYKE